MSAGTLGELFRNWLVLRQADILPLKGDDEEAEENRERAHFRRNDRGRTRDPRR